MNTIAPPTIRHDVLSLGRATEILQEKNLAFEEIVIDAIPSRNWYTGRPTLSPGIHHYFVMGGFEIAYYTPMMDTLFIFGTPRPRN